MSSREVWQRSGLVETPTSIKRDLGYARRAVATAEVERLSHDRAEESVGMEALAGGPWDWPGLDFRMDVGYKTGSGNLLTFLVDGTYIDRKDIPLLTLYETYSLCGDCKGSSGGCPGFAPLFGEMRPRSDELFVVAVSVDFAWAYAYATPGKYKIINQLTYMDRLTDCYVSRIRKAMAARGAGFGFGVGNCGGCRPVKCTVISGRSCQYPDKRTFSMEAVGIDCDELHYQLYGEFLPWYYKGTNLLQTYMTRYFAFFVEYGINYTDLLDQAVLKDKSYFKEAFPVEPPTLYKHLMEAPHGVHRGYRQYVYSNPVS